MSVTISNTELNNSFNSWRLNTNFMATVISNNVVTVARDGSANRGGLATGNGHVNGTFSANVLRTPTLQGGNTSDETLITIESNTTIEATEVIINANTTFNSNVTFNTTGADRVNLGDIDRVILGGGSPGQFIRTEDTTDNPQYKFLTLRDITDMSTNSAHIILSGANSTFSDNGDTTHLIFGSGADYIHMYLAKDAVVGDSDLFINLADADGDSRFVIADSANVVVAHIDSDGNVDITGTLNVDGSTTLNGVTATTVQANGTLDVLGLSSLDGGIDVDGAFTVADTTGNIDTTGTLNVDGDTTLNGTTVTTLAANGTSSLNDTTVTTLTANLAVDFKSTLNVDGSTTLNGTTVTTLGANGTSSLNDTTVTTLSANGTSSLNDTTVTTLTANLAVDFKSTLNVDGSTSLNELTTTTITANGDVDLKSNVDIGDANTDTLSVSAEIDTHLVPSVNNNVMLGKHQKQWSNLFVIDANVASTLYVDGSSQLNGTTVTTLTANLAVDFNSTLNVDGATTLNGDVTLGDAQTDTITVKGKFANQSTTGTASFNGDMFLGNQSTDTITVKGNFANQSTTGLAQFNGSVDIGNANTDTLTITSEIDSHVIPNANGMYNLGAAYLQWNQIWVNQANATLLTTDKIVHDSTDNVVIGENGTLHANNTIKDDYILNSMIKFANLDFTVTDGGTKIASDIKELGGKIQLDSGEGLTWSKAANGAYTISGENATATNKGIASFNSGDFSVSSGAVSLADSASGAVIAISGTTNEVEVSRTNGTVTIGLPDNLTTGTTSSTHTLRGVLTANGSQIDLGENRTGISNQATRNAMYNNGGLQTLNVYANTVFHDKVTLPSDTILTISEGTFTTLSVTSSITDPSTGGFRIFSQNTISSIAVTDSDSGYTYTDTGTYDATGTVNTLTLISGEGVDIDIDTTNKGVRIASTFKIYDVSGSQVFP